MNNGTIHPNTTQQTTQIPTEERIKQLQDASLEAYKQCDTMLHEMLLIRTELTQLFMNTHNYLKYQEYQFKQHQIQDHGLQVQNNLYSLGQADHVPHHSSSITANSIFEQQQNQQHQPKTAQFAQGREFSSYLKKPMEGILNSLEKMKKSNATLSANSVIKDILSKKQYSTRNAIDAQQMKFLKTQFEAMKEQHSKKKTQSVPGSDVLSRKVKPYFSSNMGPIPPSFWHQNATEDSYSFIEKTKDLQTILDHFIAQNQKTDSAIQYLQYQIIPSNHLSGKIYLTLMNQFFAIIYYDSVEVHDANRMEDENEAILEIKYVHIFSLEERTSILNGDTVPICSKNPILKEISDVVEQALEYFAHHEKYKQYTLQCMLFYMIQYYNLLSGEKEKCVFCSEILKDFKYAIWRTFQSGKPIHSTCAALKIKSSHSVDAKGYEPILHY